MDDENNSDDDEQESSNIPEIIEPSEDQPIMIFIDEEDMPDEYYTGI